MHTENYTYIVTYKTLFVKHIAVIHQLFNLSLSSQTNKDNMKPFCYAPNSILLLWPVLQVSCPPNLGRVFSFSNIPHALPRLSCLVANALLFLFRKKLY